MSEFCCLGYVVLFLFIYKALDWLVRKVYMGGYAERYILVTGCDSGFGNLAAKRLDKLGCHVFAGCMTESGASALQKSCSNTLKTLLLDVTKAESVRGAYGTVKAALPAGRGLWGIVNNAGILESIGPAEWLTINDYKRLLDVNLYGLIDVTMTFLPLVKMARGRVVNTSSVYGRFTAGVCNPYTISKYAVEAFSDGIRRTLYPFGVKVLIIEPGFHRTPLIGVDVMSASALKCWTQASEEVRKEFGDEYFKHFSTTSLQKLYDMGSDRPSDVADAYVHALLGLFPRARYLVGNNAKYIWLPIQWLPEWLGDWAVRKFDADMPLPAAVQEKDK